MNEHNQYPRNVWLEVDLAQFKKNIEIIKEAAKTRVLIVVKANAYGHGLAECGKAAEAAGVEMLGVATVGEAAILRTAGVKIPLLRITAYGLNEVESFIRDDVHFFIWQEKQTLKASEEAKKQNKTAKAHLKIDTGMGRAGIFPEEVEPLATAIDKAENVKLAGVLSHLHSADADNLDSAKKQLGKFNEALDALDRLDMTPEYVHLANSPGLLRLPEARYNMVRSGVITYGMFYERGYDLPEGMKPIASWKARMVSVRTLPPGHAVGYGAEYVTSGTERIAILPVGYADGFHRFPKNVNQVLLRGERVSTVGRICMDQCMIRVPDHMDDVQDGEEVVLVGEQGGKRLDALDLGDKWGTNNYEVIANISPRVPRVYI